MNELENCPVCGEKLNHWIDNGYRNEWPLSELDDGQRLVVCTDETDRVFVHVDQPSTLRGETDE